MSPSSLVSLLLAVAFTASATLVASPVRADETATDPKTEARDRFGRGLRLFNDGDNAGALAEFKRAHELSPHPVVAFNIGLVYAAMGRAIESVAALDEVIKNPGTLASDKLEKAKRTREEQLQRIAEIDIKANVEGAEVEIDGVRADKLPLAKPLKVTSGSRIVGVLAPGHLPERREVTLAGGTKKQLVFELKPFEGRLAHVAVKSKVPGASVLVDGRPVGVTPLAALVSVAPGKRTITLRRAGYTDASRTLELGDATQGEVSLDPAVDTGLLDAEGGRLALDLSEPECHVSINGVSHGRYVGSLRMPAGPHRIRVVRDGFDPVERVVDVPKGRSARVRVVLEPTPEYRQRYEKKARLFNTWGWVGVIGGAVVTGAGVGFLIWNQGKKDGYIEEGELWRDKIDAHSVKPPPSPDPCPNTEYCNQRLQTAIDSYDRAKARDLFGWITVGVGGGALVAGTVLLVTGDDPKRYERERPELGRRRFVPLLSRRDGVTTLGLAGDF